MALNNWKRLKNNYPFVKGFFMNTRNGDYLTVKHIYAVGKAPFFYPAT